MTLSLLSDRETYLLSELELVRDRIEEMKRLAGISEDKQAIKCEWADIKNDAKRNK